MHDSEQMKQEFS